MFAPLVLVSALGFNAATDTKPLLALRGGTLSTNALVDTFSTINVISGTSAWLAPRKSLEMYGAPSAQDVDVFFIRSIGALQIALGAALTAGKTDVNTASLVFFYGHLFQCLAAIPIVEKLNVPTAGLIGSGVVIAALAELTRLGVLKPSHLTNIAIVFHGLISLSEIFMPTAVLDAFGFTEGTALTKFLMGSYSTAKLQLGAFLLASKLTGKPGLGLLAVTAVGVANCVKGLLTEAGIGKEGPLGWIGVQGTLGLLAYMSA